MQTGLYTPVIKVIGTFDGTNALDFVNSVPNKYRIENGVFEYDDIGRWAAVTVGSAMTTSGFIHPSELVNFSGGHYRLGDLPG